MHQQILIDDLAKKKAAELRELLASTDEPASIFDLTAERKIK